MLDGIVTQNNPVMFSDPSGEFFSLSSLSTSMAIGGILNSIISYEPGQALSNVAENFIIGSLEGVAFYGIGGGIAKLYRLSRISRLSPNVQQYLNRIIPLGPKIPGFTNLYKQFIFKTWAGNIRVSSGVDGGAVTGALKHVVESILRTKATGSAAKTQLAEALALKELEAAINLASVVGIESGKEIIVRTSYAEWRLVFEAVNESGGVTYKLFHALVKVFH